MANLKKCVLLGIFLFCITSTFAFQFENIEEIVIGDIGTVETLGIEKNIIDFEFLKLENSVDSYVQNIHGSMSVGDRYVFLTDFQMAFLFSRDGSFIKKIGKRGKGPGEYIIADKVLMSPDEDKLLICDTRGQQILLYDMKGNCTASRPLDLEKWGFMVSDIGFLNNDVVSVSMNNWPLEDFHSLLFLDKDLKLISKANPKNAPAYEARRAKLMNRNDGLLFWENGNDTIHYIKSSCDAIPALVINTTGRGKKKFKVTGVSLLPDQLIIYANDPTGNKRIYSYLFQEKRTREIRTEISDFWNDEKWNGQTIYQRANGYYVLGIGKNKPMTNKVVSMFLPGLMLDIMNLQSIDRKKVAFPEAQNALCRILKEATLEDNPILIITNLK